MAALPNPAHFFIAELEKHFDVQVVTQNIDDLHERAGSTKVLHLHGEIMKARSSVNSKLVYDLKADELKEGDLCADGSQLRPHIVWFGEMVPEMDNANAIAQEAELFVVIGTSLNVYPAAGMLNFVFPTVPKWLVDPGDFNLDYIRNLKHIKTGAVKGVEILKEELSQYL
jgi:NAD-dependent deacetylase